MIREDLLNKIKEVYEIKEFNYIGTEKSVYSNTIEPFLMFTTNKNLMAIRKSAIENDVYHSNSDEWFDKYISPYLKEEKRDLGAENFTESRILRVLPNGSAFAFNVNAITFFPFADDYYKCAQYGND